ncbi:protein FAR1-RELATED SEQUENCE 8-like [Camellia sinensis]|uniref:protein FAR1-RELATED SEQUENCE 8-like n=1 Tax=Camellia sinensis TaxID=4442 RepID=UPI001035E5FF|nr:protein FAR1-RELATED SEQUENCE 8-like [Camellia sinensis]
MDAGELWMFVPSPESPLIAGSSDVNGHGGLYMLWRRPAASAWFCERDNCKVKAKRALDFYMSEIIIEVDSNGGDNPSVNEGEQRRLEINDQAGIGVSRNYHSIVVEAGGYESLTFDKQDARNYINRARRLRLGEETCFGLDARSRAMYESFGDIVSFDTIYLTNKYDMPFAPFVGVNHHGQYILLGCGLLSSENTDTFVWLFKSWLSCMSNKPPKAIITDQCRAMQNAIKIVFPQAWHRWCLWHVMKKIPEKLKGYAQYEPMKLAMQNAIYDCLTRDEFEKKWEEMLTKFNLYDNEWLGVLYHERHRWVPVYVKDIFGAEKEKKSDIKSRHKFFDCLTIYGFEKQFHTNAKFKEVQGELKRLVYCQALIVKEEGAICTYNVQEAMVVCDKMKHVDFVVYFNSIECEVQCMCRLFQFRGIMCAHSLAVLVRRCINEVPSKYILPRWRKDLVREYTCIKTTYTGFGDDFNTICYERMNEKLIAIIQLAGNSEGKIKIIDRGLDEMKDKVMHDESGDGSNLPPSTNRIPSSTKSPIATGCTSGASTRKVVSPLVVRRRGRPVMKRKVAKVDQIVNRFKAAYMVGMQNSVYAPVVNAIGGTSLIPSNFVSSTPRSLMSAPTQFFGSGSLTPSGSNCLSILSVFEHDFLRVHAEALLTVHGLRNL